MSILNENTNNAHWDEIETIPLHGDEDDEENEEYDSTVELEEAETAFHGTPERRQHSTSAVSKRTSYNAQPKSTEKLRDADNQMVVSGNMESRRASDGSSVASQSDTRSFREKLRDRISIVKEQAGISAMASHYRGQINSAKTSKQTAISRITDLLYKEEANVEAVLEKHRRTKESKKLEDTISGKRRVSSIAQIENTREVGYNAGIEFFTRMWNSTEDFNNGNQITQSQDDNNISEDNEDDGAKLLAADYLGLKDSMVEPTEFKNPSIMNTDHRLKQQQMIFLPSTEPVPTELRIGENKEIRNLKEEGLYVPNYPAVRRANVNKFHQRLVSSKDLRWFAEDGEPVRLPDPLELNPTLPQLLEDDSCDNTQFTYYEPAILFGEQHKEIPSIFLTDEDCYILEFEILNIIFSHHPLFSREHVISNRVIQLYEKYENRQKVAYTKRLATRLGALRKARDNLKDVLKHEDNQDIADCHLERLNRYKKEIRETREERLVEGKNDNKLLINLLSTWKDLKRIRDIQGYICTPVKLQIIQLDNSNSTEWQNEIERQTEEVIEEMKDQIKSKTSSQKDTRSASEHESDLIIDIEQIKEKVICEVSESILTPNEPALSICMAEQRVTQDNELSNAMEMQRRSLLRRSLMWYKIYYNGHEVCKSSPQSLDSQFTCSFNQKLTIRIQEWPETLSVQMYCDAVPNKGIFNDNPMAQIFIPIPGKGVTLRSSGVEFYEFSSQQEVGAGVRHSGVGSRVPFKLFPEDNASIVLHSTATLACKTGWAMHNDRILSPPEDYFDYIQTRRRTPLSSNNINILSDTSKLKEWIRSTQIDPNDPNNAALFELVKKTDSDITSIQPEKFCISSVQQMFDFCSEEELTMNSRLKLLMLRDKGEIEFKSIKGIPLREWEIPKDIFKMYEQRVSSPDLPFHTFGFGQLEIHRAWGHHSLNMIYDRILKQCRLSQQFRTTEDVVHEEKVPSLGMLGLTFMKLLQPKRPLRPRRKGRKRIPVKGLTGQQVKVIVNVVRAFEVPIRKDVDVLQETSISYIRVRPFVEITFRGQTKRTVTADGPNPTWNQDLQFSLLGPNDTNFHVSSMQSFEDSLHLHLFDEIVVDILEDERRRDTTIHQRLERNWLGSLRIPFSTLYFNHQVEGTFQLYSPPFLLGYDRHVSTATSDTSHLRNSTFLTLFIIVQPPLSPPDTIMEHLECSESSYLERHLESWSKEVSKRVPNRPIKTFITDTSGKSVCVTRFFRPIAPPVIYDKENTTPEMIARYVSLIPVSSSAALIFGHFNVWLTSDQIIRLLLGEREDHAVLLCCFLLNLGLKAWLLLGNGIPHGHSAYVLTRHDTPMTTPVYHIWDPVTGLKYSSFDSFSPLHRVYCLINDENIWVNVQTEELVRRTNFDVSQQGDWLPAFDRNNVAPTSSVQPAMIEYSVTSSTDVHLLQDKVEKHLRESIVKWRPTSRTIWNRYCISTLRKLLPILEREACSMKQHNSSEHLMELQHILSSYKVCGFPISQPFTNIESILESVKSTGVHLNENPDVEFALAVYIHAYQNDVLSIWVYAVSLIARR